jgi:hypothetical protein
MLGIERNALDLGDAAYREFSPNHADTIDVKKTN